MAAISFGVNDSLTKKVWGRGLIREALKDTSFSTLTGTSEDSVVQIKEDLKEKGDRVRFDLVMQATGDGTTEAEIQEGNEEGFTIHYDDLIINELGHAHRVKDQGTIDEQRVPFTLREQCRKSLRDWWTERMENVFFNQVCGNTVQTNTKYTGFNATTAPTTTSGNTRHLWTEAGTSDDTNLDSSGDEFTLAMIDKAVVVAKTATPRIRPAKISGYSKRMFVCFLHPNQVYQLRQGSLGSTLTWAEIQKAVLTAKAESDNPVFSGDRAIGIYNNTLLLENPHVTTGNTSTTTAVANVRRAVFCGAQAAVMAYGKGYGQDDMDWNEETFDYKREFGVRASTVFGLKATKFNSIDFGKIVISSYSPTP